MSTINPGFSPNQGGKPVEFGTIKDPPKQPTLIIPALTHSSARQLLTTIHLYTASEPPHQLHTPH